MKNSWVGVVTAGCPVRVATSWDVLPLPSVLENSSPLLLLYAKRCAVVVKVPVLLNRVVTSLAENRVGVELAPVRPSLKPELLNTSSLVGDTPKSVIVLVPGAL